MKFPKKSGFTLVELSIVLVIIGLLIGGILVAQSMISTARIQSQVQKVIQYEIAIRNFRTNYKDFPGESPNFNPPGNPDLTSGYGAAGAVDCVGLIANWESFQVWTHLSQAGMIKDEYIPYSPNDPCGGPHGYNDSGIAGVVVPYTELSSRAAEIWPLAQSIPLAGTKAPIHMHIEGTTKRGYLQFYIRAEDVLGVENKMGGFSDYGTARNDGGLTNATGAGSGTCYSETYSPAVRCTASNALATEFQYFLR